MNKIDRLLKEFTSRDEGRLAMQKPCLVGEHVYATDAHCLIKVPVKYLDGEYYEVPKFPDAAGVIEGFTFFENPIRIYVSLIKNTIDSIEKEDEYEPCGSCYGKGVIECEICHHEEDCEMCGGDGQGDKIIGKKFKDKDCVKIENCYYKPDMLLKIINACEAHEVDSFEVLSMLHHRALVVRIKETIVLIMPIIFDSEYTAYDVYKQVNT